jgi:hypothetical protein
MLVLHLLLLLLVVVVVVSEHHTTHTLSCRQYGIVIFWHRVIYSFALLLLFLWAPLFFVLRLQQRQPL